MLRLEHIWSLWMNHLVNEQFPNPIQLFSTTIASFWWKDSIAKVFSNHSSRREYFGFSLKRKVLESRLLNHYFIITFKVDKTFDYEGLEQAIFEAVSSNGIDIKSQLLRSMIEFEIPEKEFSAASVRFLNLK